MVGKHEVVKKGKMEREPGKTIKNNVQENHFRVDSPSLFLNHTIIFYLFYVSLFVLAKRFAIIINMYSSFVTLCIHLE